MFLDPGDLFEHLLRVFTQNGIEVGRHYRASAPGITPVSGIHCGRPFLDIWGIFGRLTPRSPLDSKDSTMTPKRRIKVMIRFCCFAVTISSSYTRWRKGW